MAEKNCTMSEGTNSRHALSLNQLDDDCLESIFKFLPLCDRLRMESVCKKWQQIFDSMWKSYRSFDVSEKPFCVRPTRIQASFNHELIKRVFKKCASRLVKVNLSLRNGDMTYSPKVVNLFANDGREKWADFGRILLDCSNIEELTLDLSVAPIDETVLSHLLEANEKLRFLHLEKVQAPEYPLERLRMRYENLETLHILNSDLTIKSLDFSALKKSEKLRFLSLDEGFRISTETLLSYSPKNLEYLNLCRIFPSKGIPTVIANPENFESLKVLSVSHISLDDNIIRNLVIRSKHLMAVRLSVRCISEANDITLQLITALLPNLIYLHLTCLMGPRFTDAGLCNPNKNLKVFITGKNDFTDQGLIDFVREAQSLEILDLSFCRGITVRFVYLAIELMKIRSTNNNLCPLKIRLNSYDIFNIAAKISNLNPHLELLKPRLPSATNDFDDYKDFLRRFFKTLS